MATIRPAGDRAILIDLGSVTASELHRAAASVRMRLTPPACVPGHSSLLLVYEEPIDVASVGREVARALDDRIDAIPQTGARIEIPVSFDPGDAIDLPELLGSAGMSRDNFLATIERMELHARFLGFRPGFAYLDGVPERLQMPRRPTSRARIPEGSFALAGSMAGFYPGESAGGWNVLGRTGRRLWDPSRERPNLIAAGDVVRIIPTEAPARPLAPVATSRDDARPQLSTGEPLATVLRAGQWTAIVTARDLSRYERGLPPGGPFDVDAAAAANLAAGNESGAALFECTFVGPSMKMLRDSIVAVSGADVEVRVDSRTVEHPAQFSVRRGEVLDIGGIRNGARCCVAFGGGIDHEPGQRGSGTSAIGEGQIVMSAGRSLQTPRIRSVGRDARLTIRVRRGPHESEQAGRLLAQEWEVSAMSDRTGVRLSSLGSIETAEASMPSCGIVFGTVQHHPNGELVIMGPDHPVTGGYLQPFTVVSTDLWKLAQLRPRETIRFRE